MNFRLDKRVYRGLFATPFNFTNALNRLINSFKDPGASLYTTSSLTFSLTQTLTLITYILVSFVCFTYYKIVLHRQIFFSCRRSSCTLEQ